MALLSKKLLLIVIFILVVMLMLNIFFGCRGIQEGFEAKEMTEEAVEVIKNMDPKKATELIQKMLNQGIDIKSEESVVEEGEDEEPEEETVSTPEKKSSKLVKDILSQEVPQRPLTQKEVELFQAISKDEVSNEDLEKLVKAGIITEGLVERFLNTLQEEVPTQSEEVVEGFSCQRDFATF